MILWFVLALALLLAGPLLTLAFGKVSVGGDWRTATHRSAGFAPDPASHRTNSLCGCITGALPATTQRGV